MSYPQGPPDPSRPQDTPRGFPTYGRPPEPVNPPSPPPQAPGWQAPGQQPAPYGQPYPPPAPYGQQYPPPTPHGQQHPPPYGYGYGYGYPGAGMVKTNSLAIAALVCGLGGLVIGLSAPVGVGLGIAALVQIKRRGESGKGMAIGGIVVGGLITAFGVGLLALALIIGFSEADSADGPSTRVDSLAVGECFNEGWGMDEVHRRSCSEEHDGEIVANVTLPAGPYPGDGEVDDLSRARCDAEFGKYVGTPRSQSELESDYWYPEEDDWDSGDRLVVCAAYGPDYDLLTRTVKDSKR
ncbi:DUF4190 domain-containing protein [Kribbella sp. CA-294648]|uniref:DUF4190 domain-containing protein n=1 Tax=Kribbella sp. CA-294648 TaxID=3239948 RepID=UPI003D8B082D